MKKRKILFGVLIAGLCSTILASCGGSSTGSIDGTNSSGTSITDTTSGSSTDLPEFIDYVHNDPRAKLKLDYKNENGESRNFFEDGVGQVTLRNTIDGDTAHFDAVGDTSGKHIKARFYGIDTPESTGQIEKWGESASQFTSGKLEEAKKNGTIVLSSPSDKYEPPQFDSTGSRHLCLVWVNLEKKNADVDELFLLNLWVVQEGYSAAKATDKIPDLAELFIETDLQAQIHKLHIWDPNAVDPNWNESDYEPVSLIAIKDEERWSKEKGYKNPYYGANVYIQATVTGYSDHIVYVQEYYDYDWLKDYLDDCLEQEKITLDEYETRLDEGKEGAYAGIGLFTGMSFSNNAKYTTPNTRIEVNGQVGYKFGLQIQGISFPNYYSGGINEVSVIATAKEVTENDQYESFRVHNFDVNSSDLKHDDTFMFMKVNVMDELTVVGGKDDPDSVDIRLDVADSKGNKLNFSVNINFIFFPDPVNHPRLKWNSYEYFVGKKFTVAGIYYFFTYTSGDYSVDYYNVLPTLRNDITLLSPID